MAKDLFAEGIRLWLDGDKQSAADIFTSMCHCESMAETAVGKGMALWCESQQDEALAVVKNLSTAVARGFVDLNCMAPLGIAADFVSNSKGVAPLQKIGLKRLAVDALRLAGELSGPVKMRIQAVDNEVISYRLASAEHNLLKLRNRYKQDYLKYEQMHLDLLDLRKGRVEVSVALVDKLLFQSEPSVPREEQQLVAGETDS